MEGGDQLHHFYPVGYGDFWTASEFFSWDRIPTPEGAAETWSNQVPVVYLNDNWDLTTHNTQRGEEHPALSNINPEYFAQAYMTNGVAPSVERMRYEALYKLEFARPGNNIVMEWMSLFHLNTLSQVFLIGFKVRSQL